MKNLKMMMLCASVAMTLFTLPSCRKDKVDPAPTEQVETQQPNEQTPVDPDTNTPTDPDNNTPADPEETPLPVASNFSEITRAHVLEMESQLTDAYFETSNSGGVIWQAGDIYVYKTNTGAFGKFTVKSVEPAHNYRLTIEAVTYNADGSIAKEETSLVIEGKWACDLDKLIATDDFTIADFYWSRSTSVVTYFSPIGGAIFTKYTVAE